MPEARELGGQGNWEVQSADGKADEGSCGHLRQFDSSKSCWFRTFANVRIRPGEPDLLEVWVVVMPDDNATGRWLAMFSPLPNILEWEPATPFLIGQNARMWNLRRSQFPRTQIAFTRDSIAVVISARQGSPEQVEGMFESIEEALLDRVIGFR